MERLQPILKQKFWILLGIGIVMTVVGWWMATGTMAATITSRTADIKAAEGKIPKGEIPNNDWSTGLATVNTQQELAVKTASRILWERQRARMTWPDTVTEFAWKMGYRGESIDIVGRENYRVDYNNDSIRVWETVRPFNRVDGSGIVDFSFTKFPHLRWPSAPLSAAMWDAQEDLWLLEALLQTIAEINGGPTSTRQDACIHVIEKLTLHGGQPAGQRTLATAGGGSTAGGVAMPEMPTGGNFGGGNFGGAGGSGNATAVSADFDVTEELGSDGGSGGQGAVTMAMPGPGGPSGTAAAAKRYIDDDPALPFKTRGFYMTLIMDHRKIPNLVAELSASERSAWPIEIVRVQYVRLHDDDTEAGGAGASAGYNPGALGSEPPTGGQGAFTDSPFGSTPTPAFTIDGGTAGTGAGATQSQAAMAALMTAVQDPNMARVAICGIITLYKEVKPEAAAPTNQPQPAATSAPTEDNSTTPRVKPVEGTTPDSNTDTPTDAKPSTPAEGEPATPGSNPPPSNEATPKKDETPPVPPAAKSAESP